jgi:hypothetical protein
MKCRLALVLAVSVAGCGGPTKEASGSASTPPAADAAAGGVAQGSVPAAPADAGPCGAITEADATEIMGHPMKRGQGTQASECLMVSASGDATKSVTVQFVPGTQMFDSMGPGTTPLSGVGDKAALMGGGNVVIAVKSGRTYMGGVYDGTNLAGSKEKAIALARKAVSGM